MSADVSRSQREAVNEVRASMGWHTERSRLGLGAPVRVNFFRQADRYPMAELMSGRGAGGGGRGGRTRLALLLSLIWVASGKDHSSTRPASFWARLLGMRDPDVAGARAIRSTWAELERRRFVRITEGRFSGDVPTVTLLNETGTGAPYTIPTGSRGDIYFRVPEALWKSGLLRHEDGLSGPGLVMYLASLQTMQSTHQPVIFFPSATFHLSYGMSETTRKNGLRNLVTLNVLDLSRRAIDSDGGIGHRRWRRNTYELAEHLALPPRVAVPPQSQSVINLPGQQSE